MKIKVFLVSIILLILMFGLWAYKNYDPPKKESKFPKITLKGETKLNLLMGETYKEYGFKATDAKDGDLTEDVTVEDNIDYDKIGVYEIIYTIKNSRGYVAEAKRYVSIKEKPTYKDSYDKIDNKVRGWWSGNKKDHTRPSGGADINELKKYSAYFIGNNEKVIYLTFDEGGNNTYLDKIVDILNENDVKATFFLCGQFILDNKELIKKMEKNGHSVGNHTDNHENMPSLATRANFNTYLKEIQGVEDNYYEVTGKPIDKIYREPRGEWSYRSLQIMKDLGYKSYFYSADYYDFAEDVTKEHALNELMKRYHNGAIYLIHPKNKGNYKSMDSFIKEMKKLGYKFDLVKNIP